MSDNSNARSPPDVIAQITQRQPCDPVSGGHSTGVSRALTHVLGAARRPACRRDLAAALTGRLVVSSHSVEGETEAQAGEVTCLCGRRRWPSGIQTSESALLPVLETALKT